jgi:hypothetical protein
MTVLRSFVFLASSVQIAAGAYAGYRMHMNGTSTILWMIVCALLVIAGLTSLSTLLIRRGPSQSRLSAIKLNAMVFGLILVGAGMIVGMEHQQGMGLERLQLLGSVALAIAAPFLINSLALGMIERRASRPA